MLRRAFFKVVMIVPALITCTFGSDDEEAQASTGGPGARRLEDGETLDAKHGLHGWLYVDGKECSEASFHAHRKGNRVVIKRYSEDWRRSKDHLRSCRPVITTVHKTSNVVWIPA